MAERSAPATSSIVNAAAESWTAARQGLLLAAGSQDLDSGHTGHGAWGMHNFNYYDYLQGTERLRGWLLETRPNLMQRHDGLVAEPQAHHLLVLAAIAGKGNGRRRMKELLSTLLEDCFTQKLKKSITLPC